MAQRDQGEAVAEMSFSATTRGSAQICEQRPTRKRWFIFSESQVQKRSWMMKIT